MKKKIISFIVAIAVVITSLNLPIASSAATQADGNLLYGLTAKYSNIGGNGASDIAAITDGNNANGSGHAWIQKATGTDYMWVQFDFNNATDINKIYLVQKWDYNNSKPLDFLDDIAIDVRLASGGWKRVAEAHDIPYAWNNTGKTFTFSKESVLSVRITANSLRNSNSNFCLVEVEGYCDESITEYSGIETLDNETYAIPKALSDMNLVRGMTAKYSNIYGQASDIALITDGYNANGTGHAWIQKATGTDYMWVQFDFNNATDINKIYLVQKWDYNNSKPLDFLDDIAIDVRLASGGWKRVAEAHDIPYTWDNTGKAFTFAKESVLSVRITANSLRNSNSNFCLVEVEGYCDESIKEYSGIETLDNEVYAVPEALSDMNLVRGITATSSNNDGWFASNRPISNLTDGKSDPHSDMASIGNSNDELYEWVQLDLPQAKLVNKVVIQHRDGQTTPKDFAIDVLLENGTWKRVATDYNLSSIYSPTTMTFSPEKVTSIKITSNGKRAGATSMHLTEVMAYYDCSISNYTGIEKVDKSQYAIPLSSDTVNVLPGSTFTANNEYYDGGYATSRPLDNLIDGTTYTVSFGELAEIPYNQSTGEAYINIALSKETVINKIVIDWAGYNNYGGWESNADEIAQARQAKDFAIDVRMADGVWKRIVEQHNDYTKAWDCYTTEFCFEDIACTQIRITGYNANKQYTMAIMEMYAYCDSTVGTEEYTALETGVTISQPKSADWVKTDVPVLDDYAYSFAVVGDTQIVSKNDAKNGTTDLSDMYQYIIDKKDDYKISQVIGLGDIVDTYADGDQKEAEWNVALNALKKLDGVLPYTLIPGNHDVNWNFNYRIGNVGKLGYLNQSQIVSKYGKIEAGQTSDEPSASNTAHAFTAGGRNYLILTLEYSAKSTPGVMDWANAVVAAHPYHNVIVTTHAYLAADGSILDGSQAGSPSSYTGCESDNDGDYFWDNLIKKHDNIVMVLCGHVGVDNIVKSTKVGEKGNTVTQIMINPQDLEAEIGSTGMLAFMYFSEDGKTVQLRQYSTVWDRYYGNASQTTFAIPVIEPIQGDINADREVDVRDLIRYKKYILKTENSVVVVSELTSDLNSDSEFDTDDIIVLRKTLVGIEEYDLDSNANKSVVYLSSNGKDTWTGTESQPYGTLEKALAAVQNGGTIQIQGTYELSADFVWEKHNKTVTISGGALDGTALGSRISLGDSVTFDNITLVFTEDSYLFANGYLLTIYENITMTNRIRVYGGGQEGSTVASTDLKLYGGSYEAVFGGSNGGTVTGNTSVVVGGNVNRGITPKHDATDYFVYGGGVADTVEGSTNVVFEGSAKAHYVFGGSYGGSATVLQGTNVYITGGTVSGVYGGSNKGAEKSGTVSGGVYVEMTGGTVEQVFGGNAASDLTGDVEVKILGGTVTRRIYGGCYNEWKVLWLSKYSVNGTITLILSGNATLDQSYDGGDYHGDDLSVFARSRRNPVSDAENSVLIYVDGGENQHVSKLGAHDDDGIMSGVTAYDSFTTQ